MPLLVRKRKPFPQLSILLLKSRFFFFFSIALLDQKGASERFVKHLLVRKIKASSLTESKDVTNVFRENNSAALLAATFSLSHGGSEFVKNLITEPFQAVAGLLKAVEVNPESLPEGEGKRDQRTKWNNNLLISNSSLNVCRYRSQDSKSGGGCE